MKLLFICDNFYPMTQISAKRTTNFAMQMEKLGHDVTVVCGDSRREGKENSNDLPIRTIYCQFSRRYLRMLNMRECLRKQQKSFVESGKQKKIWFKIKEFFLLSYWAIFRFIFEKSSRKRSFFKAVRQLKNEYFDICITSFSNDADPLCRLPVFLKKKGAIGAWIMDCRDALVLKNENGKLKARHPSRARFLNRIVSGATCITAVSDGQAEMLKAIIKSDKPYEVLYNGYEGESKPKDRQYSFPLKFSYTGTMYINSFPSNQCDADALFKAIKYLIEKKGCKAENFEVHYAGNDYCTFIEKSRAYGLEGILINHGYISRNEATLIQSATDIQLLFCHNTEYDKGVLRGKFGEYIGNHQPVLALIQGNVPDSDTEILIEKMGLGFAYAYYKDNFEDLCNYILQFYNKCREGVVEAFAYKEGYQDFAYVNVCEKLNNILNEIVNTEEKK